MDDVTAETELAACFMLASFLAYPSALKMEAIYSSETSVKFKRTTRRYIPDDKTRTYSV
jgi:hypothetical protein